MTNSAKTKSVSELIELKNVRAPNGTWVSVSEDVYQEFRDVFKQYQTCGDELIKSWSNEFDVEVIAFNNNLIHAKNDAVKP